MKTIAQRIEDLIVYAEKYLFLSIEDRAFARNQLLELFQVEPDLDYVGKEITPVEKITEPLIEYAINNGITEEGTEQRFETKILGLVTPSPSSVAQKFITMHYKQGSEKATKYLYEMSINNRYIRMNDIKRNIFWSVKGKRGPIGITINLSKPEKDPKQVLAERTATTKKYPKCMLCMENLGFCGTATYPARQTLRAIPLKLFGEPWHMQYSPYVYYDQHCIVFNDKHVPMKISENTIARLIEFVAQFPKYFLGSNADLPIVGGSILSHDHYQGGSKVLPMLKAPFRKIFTRHENIEIGIKDWYNSVITIRGDANLRYRMVKKASTIIDAWRSYSDEEADIMCETDGMRHNTVTPIAYRVGKKYYIDLILRNNRTDEKHPFGIFHPTEDMHNIKKEAIGLIEAMGLFILPGRLKKELQELMVELQKEKPNLERIARDPVLSKHFDMLVQIMADKGAGLSEEEARQAVIDKVSETCFKILECTAVFKNTKKGRQDFVRFMDVVVERTERVS